MRSITVYKIYFESALTFELTGHFFDLYCESGVTFELTDFEVCHTTYTVRVGWWHNL